MHTRKSGILALVVGAMVLGACEQKAPIVNIPPTPTVTTVTISGAPSQPIKKGTTIQLVAVVSGNDNQAVTWSVLSGGTAASVSATGLVTALNPGTAVIQAQSQAVAAAKAAVSITVADTTGGTIGQPSITIGSITQGGTTFPVNLGNVAGTIDVTMNVDIPAGVKATALQLSIKNSATGATTVVPCQTFSATGSSDASVEGAQAPQIVICSVPTAQVGANGVPTFPNGQYTITAQLLNGTTVIASAVTQTLVFNNVSSLQVSVAAAKTAPDAAGLVWNGGNLTVTVTPSIFASGTTFQSFTVTVTGKDTLGVSRAIQKTVATTGVAPVTVTFRSDSSSSAGLGLSGIEDPAVTVGVTGVTTAGTQFDNGGLPYTPTPNALKYDAAAPRLTGVVPTYNLTQQPVSLFFYLKSTATFTNTCSLAAAGPPPLYTCGSSSTAATFTGVAEAGVDVVTWTFQTSPSPLASSPVWTTQTSVAGIGNQPPASLQARVGVCDNLGNCKNIGSANFSVAFGVDMVLPIISAVTNVSGVQANPVLITVAAQDTGATAGGFPLRYISAQITKDSASSTASGGVDVQKCVTWRSLTASIAPDSTFSVPSSGCPFKAIPVDNATTIAIDNTVVGATAGTSPGNGYYTVTVRATDIAGNVSTTVQKFFLLDTTMPVVSGVAITYTTGASTATVAGTIHDNVDLKQWNTRESYAGAIIGPVTNLPFTAENVVKAYGLPVQGNVAPNVTLAFVGGISTTWGGAPIVINGLGFAAYDQAGNFAETYQAFTAAPVAVSTTDVVSSAVAVSPATICQTGTNPPCADVTKTSTTATAQLVMNATATANPLVTVYFYYIDAAGRAQFVSSTTASSLVIPSLPDPNANKRVFTYTSASISAASLPLGGVPVFAVGVDKNGVGVLLGTAPVTVQ